MPKVLVFESDAAFANLVATGLAQYDCTSQVVDDGEAGIAIAERDAPDLILLSIELPRMNGFSVCNKLKRNGKLKSVPLVLLSSEATDETFEQHKRLRTRAEEYLHKPLTVEQLVEKIQPFIQLTKLEGASVASYGSDAPGDAILDEEVVIDDIDVEEPAADETDLAFGHLLSQPANKPISLPPPIPVGRPVSLPPPPPSKAPSALDMQAEALELEPDEAIPVAAPVAPASAPEQSEPEDPPTLLLDVNQITGDSSAPAPELTHELAQAKARIDELGAELARAEEAVRAEEQKREDALRRKHSEIEILQGEVDELKRKLEEKEGGASAREFLDLREQLNKKDKGIIELEERLVQKEKEVVKLNDTNIQSERDKADLTDQVRALERTKSELERARDTLSREKTEALSEAADYKQKSEQLAADLAKTSEDLADARLNHENTMARRDAQDAATREDHLRELEEAAAQAVVAQQQAVEAAIAYTNQEAEVEKEAALTAAAEEARQAREMAIAARERELKVEHDAKLAALHRAGEEAQRKLRTEHEQALAAAARDAADRLAAREAELFTEKDQALQTLEAAHAAATAAALEERRASEAERDGRIANLELDLGKRTDERDAARGTLQKSLGTLSELVKELEAARLR